MKNEKENIERAKELEKKLNELNLLKDYIDLCLDSDRPNQKIKITLYSTRHETKEISDLVPQLVPAIGIIARDEICKRIKTVETEIETL